MTIYYFFVSISFCGSSFPDDVSEYDEDVSEGCFFVWSQEEEDDDDERGLLAY
jgi:hypothetical protein